MNSLPKLCVVLLASLTFSTGAFADDVSDLLADAQRTYIRGDLTAAKEKFNLILKLDPNNRTAQGYRRRIAADEVAQQAGKPAPNATETALKKIILEKVDFHDATLVELLEAAKAGRQEGNFAAVEHNTTPATRSGWRCAISCATAPPIEYPTGMKRSMPSASAAATASSAQSSS